MPKNLITQWLKTIDLIAPGQFEIYKYHDDSRRLKSIVGERAVLSNLKQSHELFDEKEQRSRTLIISSYTTFAKRHNSAVNSKYRINKLAMSKREVDNQKYTSNSR